MGNSNKTPTTLTEKFIASVGLLVIIELLLLAGKIFGSISAKEYGLFAFTLPVIIVIWLLVLLRNRRISSDRSVKNWYRIAYGQSSERIAYLTIKGMPRNAIPSWLLSILLCALIVWRLEVDDNLVRKVLCASAFGLISVICFLIGIAVCRMGVIITFGHDKFYVFMSAGLGGGVQKEFSYDDWLELRPSQSQGYDVSALDFVGVNGGREMLRCRVSKSQADLICAYVNEQMSSHRASHESRTKRSL